MFLNQTRSALSKKELSKNLWIKAWSRQAPWVAGKFSKTTKVREKPRQKVLNSCSTIFFNLKNVINRTSSIFVFKTSFGDRSPRKWTNGYFGLGSTFATFLIPSSSLRFVFLSVSKRKKKVLNTCYEQDFIQPTPLLNSLLQCQKFELL